MRRYYYCDEPFWFKKEVEPSLCISMRTKFPKVEITNLTSVFISGTLKKFEYIHSSGLCRDNSISISSNMNRFRKQIIGIFKKFNLNIKITNNLITFSKLDIVLDLKSDIKQVLALQKA